LPDHAAFPVSALDRILIEKLREFKVLELKKLISNFSDQGWNARSFKKLLKKLRSRFRFNDKTNWNDGIGKQ